MTGINVRNAVTGPLAEDLTEISPRAYWHCSFPRVSVSLWSARGGTESVDGVCGVYVNANRDTVTLIGAEGPVRFGKGTKVVGILRCATGQAEWTHPLDTASGIVNG